jgi:hypothetical protein
MATRHSIIDDGFWFDTQRGARIWTYLLKDLGSRLGGDAQMSADLADSAVLRYLTAGACLLTLSPS